MKYEKLYELVQDIQSRGEYTFRFGDVLKTLGTTETALRLALHRLQVKKVIIRLHEKFYLIIPIEYRKAGVLPPTWFIDSLMNHLQCDYYVGLLSAAALQGAGHQQPQQFQVVVNKIFRPIQKNRIDIRFFKKSHLNDNQRMKLKTATGYLWISKPEVTAIDLINYIKSTGYLGNVVTVLTELLEKINSEELLIQCKNQVPLAILQRLGYLLDFCGGEKVTSLLYDWLKQQKLQIVSLRPDKDVNDATMDKKWKIMVNEIMEGDE